jgi:DNA-binding transcriptional LysR family regulator
MKIRHLDIESLRAFVAIVDLTSFSQAAARLGRTQSALSVQLRKLEEMLGQTLLRRAQGRVDGPTEEGRTLLDYARQMLRLNDEACQSISRNDQAGSLRIGLPEDLMESVFPAAMERFRTACPRMRLSLRSDNSAALLKALDDGELDTVFFKHCREESGDEIPVWREPLLWMAGEGYAHELPDPLPLALFSENCAFRLAATQALAAAGRAWHLNYSGASATGLRHAVRAGIGITALPRSLLGGDLHAIAEKLPVLPDARISVRHAPGEVSPAARRFVSLMGEEIRMRRAS